MPKITTAEIERLAHLARIGLSSEQVEHLTAEIGHIIGFVEQLQDVDTSGVAPTDQVTGLVDVWREDEVVPSMPTELLLAIAPAHKDNYLLVKRVLGD